MVLFQESQHLSTIHSTYGTHLTKILYGVECCFFVFGFVSFSFGRWIEYGFQYSHTAHQQQQRNSQRYGPRTRFKHTKCISKYSILFICFVRLKILHERIKIMRIEKMHITFLTIAHLIQNPHVFVRVDGVYVPKQLPVLFRQSFDLLLLLMLASFFVI